MTEEIQKKVENTAVAVTAEDLGFNNVSSDNLVLPFLKLAQNATRERPEGVNPGDFFNTASGRSYGESILIHIIADSRTRVKFTKDFKLECKSNDGIGGSCKDEIHGNGVCSACSFSTWKDTEEGRRSSYCPPNESFLIIPEGESIPAILALSKVRERAGRDLRMKLIMLKDTVSRLDPEKQLNHLKVYYKFKLTAVGCEVNGYKIFDIKVSNAGIEKDEQVKVSLLEAFRSFKNYKADAEQSSEKEEETAF